MITDQEVTEAIMLGSVLAQIDLVPDGLQMEYHARVDVSTRHAYRHVHVHPDNVDPRTFEFGTPGAYASVSVVPNGDDGFGYHVHVYATDVGYTFQQAGHVVTFTDAAEAVRTAAWLVQDEIAQQQRRGGH